MTDSTIQYYRTSLETPIQPHLICVDGTTYMKVIDIPKFYMKHGIGRPLSIRRVIFNPPATIVFWDNGTKTVVKCGEGEAFDKEKGLAMAIAKRTYGNTSSYFNIFKKFCHEDA